MVLRYSSQADYGRYLAHVVIWGIKCDSVYTNCAPNHCVPFRLDLHSVNAGFLPSPFLSTPLQPQTTNSMPPSQVHRKIIKFQLIPQVLTLSCFLHGSIYPTAKPSVLSLNPSLAVIFVPFKVYGYILLVVHFCLVPSVSITRSLRVSLM